jgi:hypothetical protein
MLGKLKEKAQVNPHVKSVHKGPVVKDLAFEKKVKDWIISQQEMDIAVHTKDIINHVIHVNPSFKSSKTVVPKYLLHGFTNSLEVMVCLFVVSHELGFPRS